MFEGLVDFEIDFEYLGLTLFIIAFFAVFLIIDPIGVGMDKTPLWARLIAIILMLPIGYMITKKIAER